MKQVNLAPGKRPSSQGLNLCFPQRTYRKQTYCWGGVLLNGAAQCRTSFSLAQAWARFPGRAALDSRFEV